MKQGSITAFCAICMMLIASLLLVLLESGRVYGLDFYAKLKAEAGIDSVCAEFQPLLWQQYGLLALDGAYGTEYFSKDYMTESLTGYITKSCQKEEGLSSLFGMDLFQVTLTEAELTGYALLTDENGELFLDYVAERTKEDLPIGVAEDIYAEYEENKQMEDGQSELVETISDASQTLASAKASKWKEIETKIEAAETEEEENAARSEAWVLNSPAIKELEKVLGSVNTAQTSGMLRLILGDTSTVSTKDSKPESDLQNREKEEGTMRYVGREDWYRKLLVLTYLEQYFSCYQKQNPEHYLAYEMEYVLCGKDTEWKNLEATLNRLLLARAAANVTYLLQDSEKTKAAESMAAAIGLLVGENPVAVKVIQIGIIGVWAYAESILDVRALITGEQIPLLKNRDEWTTDLAHVFAVFEGDLVAKKCEKGLYYADYLKQLLFFTSDEIVAFRMMEVMELGMQAESEYANCKMNQMLAAMQYQLGFQSNPIFSSLMTIGNSYDGKLHFEKKVERSYIP